MKNQHDSSIPADVLEAVKGKLTEVKELLEPHTITLTKDERRTLPKMGEKSLAFVTNSHDYCKQHPELLPAYFSIEEFTIDVDDATGLLPVKDLLISTLNLVEDTAMIAGSEAYSQALVFYNNAKVAAKNNIHGAKGVYDELKTRFPSTRRKQNGKEE